VEGRYCSFSFPLGPTLVFLFLSPDVPIDWAYRLSSWGPPPVFFAPNSLWTIWIDPKSFLWQPFFPRPCLNALNPTSRIPLKIGLFRSLRFIVVNTSLATALLPLYCSILFPSFDTEVKTHPFFSVPEQTPTFLSPPLGKLSRPCGPPFFPWLRLKICEFEATFPSFSFFTFFFTHYLGPLLVLNSSTPQYFWPPVFPDPHPTTPVRL